MNGAGKCDPNGCPEKTALVEMDKQCAGITSLISLPSSYNNEREI